MIPGGTVQRTSNDGRVPAETPDVGARQRARSHQGHLAAQHVHELRELVQTEVPQHRTEGGDLSVGHGPQLDDLKRAAPAPEALLAKEHRRAVGDANQDRRDGEDRAGDREHRGGAEDVEQPAGRARLAHDRTGLR